MSWIDKELKKRTRSAPQTGTPPPLAPDTSQTTRMADLWQRLESANNALPAELRLAADLDLPAMPAYDVPGFLVWLKAPNGAGLGFTGDALRYVWPERNQRASYNFWVRWTPDRGFRLARRLVSNFSGPKIVEHSFSDRRAEYMIQCLVTGRRITPRAVRRKRLGLF